MIWVGNPQVGLVNERRGADRVTRRLAAHVPLGLPAQLVECRLLSLAPGAEQLGHITRRGLRHANRFRRADESRVAYGKGFLSGRFLSALERRTYHAFALTLVLAQFTLPDEANLPSTVRE